MFGGLGDDSIAGGGGTDELNGGLGDDVLSSDRDSADADTFNYVYLDVTSDPVVITDFDKDIDTLIVH